LFSPTLNGFQKNPEVRRKMSVLEATESRRNWFISPSYMKLEKTIR
jgi:hypothetical protein